MYLTHMAALAVSAFKDALADPGHPVLGGKDLWVGPVFPAVEANYPGVWVTYEPDPTLSKAGIGHIEYSVPGPDGERRAVTRWLFSGTISATVVSTSRMERDELLDELVRLVAFSDEHPETGHLKAGFETNPFIAVNVMFGQVRLLGLSDSGRTPWGSDETVYEGTLALSLEGEFVSDLLSQRVLVPISEVVVYPLLGDGAGGLAMDPQVPDDEDDVPLADNWNASHDPPLPVPSEEGWH